MSGVELLKRIDLYVHDTTVGILNFGGDFVSVGILRFADVENGKNSNDKLEPKIKAEKFAWTDSDMMCESAQHHDNKEMSSNAARNSPSAETERDF